MLSKYAFPESLVRARRDGLIYTSPACQVGAREPAAVPFTDYARAHELPGLNYDTKSAV